MPSLKTMIIGCVDPRVDPFDIFGLAPGEAAVIRNVGGRITPATLQTMAMLRIVAKASGGEIGPGWNLIVLHHTDCGNNCLVHSPELLSKYFGVALAVKLPMARSLVVGTAKAGSGAAEVVD
jgi:carbonic anhydrase